MVWKSSFFLKEKANPTPLAKTPFSFFTKLLIADKALKSPIVKIQSEKNENVQRNKKDQRLTLIGGIPLISWFPLPIGKLDFEH